MARHKRRRHTAREERPESRHESADRGDRDQRDEGPGERLQKVLAAAGVGSRRDCEELIREGRVEIDRQVVTELGTRVDPVNHEIRVDGEPLRQPKRLYFAVNKPMGVVTTNFDPSGRPRVIDLVPTDERVFAVGRLDRASEGLILVTNDGEFSNRITHPRYGVEKTYLARVAGQPTPVELARLTKGVYLSDGYCRVQSIVVKKKQGQSTDLVMVLDEGRNRELRRILARVGHKVLRLKRIAVGPIKLADLPTGAWRRLMPAEIESLLSLAKEKRRASKAKKKPAKKQGGIKPVGSDREESPYLQQQALMAQPLSLDDLLRDDMEEGNLTNSDSAVGTASDGGTIGNALRGVPESPTEHDDELRFSDDTPRVKRGDVINYDSDEPAPPVPTVTRDHEPRRAKPHRGGKKPFRKPAGNKAENQDRKPFGGRTGKTAGNSRFRPRGGEQRGEGRPADGGKRYEKPAGKKFAKPAGKRFAKPAGKKFGKPGGQKFGKPAASGGKKFGKPGGKRKGRR